MPMRVPHVSAVLVVAATVAAGAQVLVHNEPHHRVVYENADLRILDVRVPVGEATLDHRHERDIVTVSMNTGTQTRIVSPSQPAGAARPPRPLADATIAEYAGKPDSHRVDNIGDAPYQLFAVENLRPVGWSTTGAVSAQSTRMATEGRAFRIYDVRLVAGAPQTTHNHTVPTVALLLSGKVMSDGPDAQAKAMAPAPVGLKQLDQPGQWLLVPKGDTHTMVRLGTADARLLEIEVR
jgi:hypothetical protein